MKKWVIDQQPDTEYAKGIDKEIMVLEEYLVESYELSYQSL